MPEGINARLLRHGARQQPPSSVEVPAMRDVIFTAIGGAGENGNTGSDGQPGMDGVDGSPASREVDATVRPILITYQAPAKTATLSSSIMHVLTITSSPVQMEATVASKLNITSVWLIHSTPRILCAGTF